MLLIGRKKGNRGSDAEGYNRILRLFLQLLSVYFLHWAYFRVYVKLCVYIYFCFLFCCLRKIAYIQVKIGGERTKIITARENELNIWSGWCLGTGRKMRRTRGAFLPPSLLTTTTNLQALPRWNGELLWGEKNPLYPHQYKWLIFFFSYAPCLITSATFDLFFFYSLSFSSICIGAPTHLNRHPRVSTSLCWELLLGIPAIPLLHRRGVRGGVRAVKEK